MEIRYNLLNLPMSVQQADSSDMARFIYLSDGTKVGAVRGDSQRISYRGSYLLSEKYYDVSPYIIWTLV